MFMHGSVLKPCQATDADDADLPNSHIRYAIVKSEYSGNFTIDPITGVLTNNALLDRESIDPDLNGKIELNLTATDLGVPALSTWVRVLINVEVSPQRDYTHSVIHNHYLTLLCEMIY